METDSGKAGIRNHPLTPQIRFTFRIFTLSFSRFELLLQNPAVVERRKSAEVLNYLFHNGGAGLTGILKAAFCRHSVPVSSSSIKSGVENPGS